MNSRSDTTDEISPTRLDPIPRAAEALRRHPILLILALALVLRIVHVDAPIGGVHSWRQADTAAMARNYHEGGYRFLYPQIDWRGAGDGSVECEFPAYPFLVALAYGVLGERALWGRVLSLLFGLAMITALYGLLRRVTGEPEALWSACLAAFLPLSVYYGRAVMPESLLLAASAAGLFWLHSWSLTGSRSALLLSAVAVSLACLVKLPALYLGIPLLFLFHARLGWRWLLRPEPWGYAMIVLLPVVLWYSHAHGLHKESGLSFGIWGYGTDKWGNWDMALTWKFWDKILFRSIAERHLTWAGFVLFVASLFVKPRSTGERLLPIWLGAVLFYFVVVTRGNYVHEYYQLPILLPAVAYMGRFLARLPGIASYHATSHGPPNRASRLTGSAVKVLVFATIALSAARMYDYWKREIPGGSPMARLAAEAEMRIPPGDRVIAISRGDPTLLYLSRGKGWLISPEQAAPEMLLERVPEGARWVIGLRKDFDEPELSARLHAIEAAFPAAYRDDDGFVLTIRFNAAADPSEPARAPGD